MEILRVPPYDVVEATLIIPTGYTDEPFIAYITDMADLSVSSQTFTGSSGDEFSVNLSAKFDNDYYVEVQTVSNGTIAIHDTYEVKRPYVNPSSKATTATEIATYAANEELARAIIDSVVQEGFYYQKKTIEVAGNNSDWMPIWDKVTKVVSVSENNVLITDRTYGISKDRTGIVEVVDGTINRYEGSPLMLPSSAMLAIICFGVGCPDFKASSFIWSLAFSIAFPLNLKGIASNTASICIPACELQSIGVS